jgi:nucleoid DNA-binding protein
MTTTARATGSITTVALAELVAAELGISHRQARRTVAAVLNSITRTVAAGHPVAITNFGSWHPLPVPARTARNPQDGAPVAVPATRRVRFTTSPRFLAAVRAADPEAAAIRKLPSR